MKTDFIKKRMDNLNFESLTKEAYPTFFKQGIVMYVKKASMSKFVFKYNVNLPKVYFKIHIEPIKNGPNINGNSPKLLGFIRIENHHHFFFSAIIPSTIRNKHINNDPGRNLLNVFDPMKGTESQGKNTIKKIYLFVFFISYTSLYSK